MLIALLSCSKSTFVYYLTAGKKGSVLLHVLLQSEKEGSRAVYCRGLQRKNSAVSAPQIQQLMCYPSVSILPNPSGFSWDLSSLCLVLPFPKAESLSTLSPLFQVSHSETPSLDLLFTSSSCVAHQLYPHLLFFIAFNTTFSLIPST